MVGMVSVPSEGAVSEVRELIRLVNDPAGFGKRLEQLAATANDIRNGLALAQQNKAEAIRLESLAAALSNAQIEVGNLQRKLEAVTLAQAAKAKELERRNEALDSKAAAFESEMAVRTHELARTVDRCDRIVQESTAAVTEANDRVAKAEAAVDRLKGALNG